MKPRTYVGEMEWAMRQALNLEHNKRSAMNAIRYGLVVNEARRYREPIPERPNLWADTPAIILDERLSRAAGIDEPGQKLTLNQAVTVEPIPDDCLPPPAVIEDVLRGPKVGPDGKIQGGVYHGMTLDEVLADRDHFNSW